MEGDDILQTFAEVFIAFAGFTSIVAVLGRRAAGDWTQVDLFRLWQMLGNSLAALLFSFLPLILFKLRFSENLSWALASAALTVFLLVRGTVVVRRVRSLPPAERAQMSSFYFSAFGVLGFFVSGLLVLNAVGVVFQRETGPYLLGILYLLGVCAFQFTRLVLVLRSGGPDA